MLKNGLIYLTMMRTIGKNQRVYGFFKDELGRKIMKKFVALRAKTYAHITDGYDDDNYEKIKIIHKKAKGTKKVCNKTYTYREL